MIVEPPLIAERVTTEGLEAGVRDSVNGGIVDYDFCAGCNGEYGVNVQQHLVLVAAEGRPSINVHPAQDRYCPWANR